MFKIGAFAIILNQEKEVLLCHRRDYDLWNLPGGGVEKGESPWKALIREVKEETGLDVVIERLHGVDSKPEKDDIVFSFVCVIKDGKIKLNDEADEIKYFDADNLPKNTAPKHAIRIKDAVVGKNYGVIMKEQFGPGAIELVKSGKL